MSLAPKDSTFVFGDVEEDVRSPKYMKPPVTVMELQSFSDNTVQTLIKDTAYNFTGTHKKNDKEIRGLKKTAPLAQVHITEHDDEVLHDQPFS